MKIERAKKLLGNLNKSKIEEFSSLNGAMQVWKSWRDNMLAQRRSVPVERMSWDTLSDIDKELDARIAYDVISDFIGWAITHPHDYD